MRCVFYLLLFWGPWTSGRSLDLLRAAFRKSCFWENSYLPLSVKQDNGGRTGVGFCKLLIKFAENSLTVCDCRVAVCNLAQRRQGAPRHAKRWAPGNVHG